MVGDDQRRAFHADDDHRFGARCARRRQLGGPLRSAISDPRRAVGIPALHANRLTHVERRLRPESGSFEDPIRDEGAQARIHPSGKPATTRWRVLAHHAATSVVEVELVTGRYNQIRLHFAHHDQALVGERKYARGKDDPLRAKRVALHAWRLAFPHPLRGHRLEAEAPLPADLRALLANAEAYAPER